MAFLQPTVALPPSVGSVAGRALRSNSMNGQKIQVKARNAG
jgi:hypothetical protein